MSKAKCRFGDLDCTVFDHEAAEGGPGLLVVLCHGYGAPGDDLVGIADAIAPVLNREQGVRFVFPEAPLALEEFADYGGRAWWPISIQQLVAAVEAGDFGAIRSLQPDGLSEAREALRGCCKEAMAASGVAWEKCIIGGFSQGSMLTVDLALRLEQPPAALVAFSGTLINEESWHDLAAKASPMKVLQSHGKLDPILPFDNALNLRKLLESSGHDVEFLEFMGPHTIPQRAMAELARLVNEAGK